MTTAERREPTFHSVGAGDDHQHGRAVHPAHAAARSSHVTRVISGFQAISTLIGVPLALASGYTLYRTNFAPDATCTNLRASIVTMLDKNVDNATRRMLVKRDVEAFESSCGAVDPDAHAAFKVLLSADKPSLSAKVPTAASKADMAKVEPKTEVVKPSPVAKDIAAKEPAKTELRPAIVEKAPVVEKAAADKPVEKGAADVKAVALTPQTAPAEAPAADTTMNDARWLDAVRSALVEPPGERKEAVKKDVVKETVFNEMPREHARPQPVVANKPGEPVLQPGWNVAAPAPAVQGTAAPLPPPVAVNDIQRAPVDPNRPVPPGSVPTAQYANNGSWVANIPFVGRIIDGSGN